MPLYNNVIPQLLAEEKKRRANINGEWGSMLLIIKKRGMQEEGERKGLVSEKGGVIY